MKIIEIESFIKKSLEKELNDLTYELLEKGITYDIELNRSGNELDYFSEIEVTFWRENNVLDIISLMMFSNGKLRDSQESLIEWFIEEVKKILE